MCNDAPNLYYEYSLLSHDDRAFDRFMSSLVPFSCLPPETEYLPEFLMVVSSVHGLPHAAAAAAAARGGRGGRGGLWRIDSFRRA